MEEPFCLGSSRIENLLPTEGVVGYFGPILGSESAFTYYTSLLENVCWRHDEFALFGKRIITKRKVAWYGDDGLTYTYSGSTKVARPWFGELQELRELVENETQDTYNSCLLNLYHDGSEGVSWHSDDEQALKENGAIASLSLGAERKFCFRHKQTQATHSLVLEDGSLLVMRGETQKHWVHSLPVTKKIKTPRISLTFRTIDRNVKS